MSENRLDISVRVKVLAAKPADLCLVPRAHGGEGTNLPESALTFTCMCVEHYYSQINIVS